jgi:hypothetical protein
MKNLEKLSSKRQTIPSNDKTLQLFQGSATHRQAIRHCQNVLRISPLKKEAPSRGLNCNRTTLWDVCVASLPTCEIITECFRWFINVPRDVFYFSKFLSFLKCSLCILCSNNFNFFQCQLNFSRQLFPQDFPVFR